ALAYSSFTNRDEKLLAEIKDRMTKAEEDVESFRRALTREVAEIGSMMMNREDLLRTAYNIEEVVSYIGGAFFRLTQLKPTILTESKLKDELQEIIDLTVEAVQRLNKLIQALVINPSAVIELANEVQKIERQMDAKYRATITKALNSVNDIRGLIMLKDIIEHMEAICDTCFRAADSATILALGL
ncbi:MAG: DUF47 family protein, partial [Nitrososphaerales archaeon]|nr:DUF47 family protein [Nitrososphaerales archaeon]